MNVNLRNVILTIDETHIIPEIFCNSYSRNIDYILIYEAMKDLTMFKKDFLDKKFFDNKEETNLPGSKGSKNEII